MVDPDKLADIERYFSREHAVNLPYDSALISYLMRHHDVPEFVRDGGLAYHYTDGAGLMGIAQSGRFWASHWQFLNDPTEARHGLAIAQRELSKIESETHLGELAAKTSVKLDGERRSDLYTVSFCRGGDLLSQWRGYGAFGTGYSLGFDIEKLRPHPQLGWLVGVSYNDNKLVEVLGAIASIISDHLGVEGKRISDEVPDWWAAAIFFLAETFKHPSYAEESELRLMLTRYRDQAKPGQAPKDYEVPVKFRARNAQIVPYLDTPLNPAELKRERRLPLKEVVVGPGVSNAANLHSVGAFLKSVGYDNVVVRASTVPFRS